DDAIQRERAPVNVDATQLGDIPWLRDQAFCDCFEILQLARQLPYQVAPVGMHNPRFEDRHGGLPPKTTTSLPYMLRVDPNNQVADPSNAHAQTRESSKALTVGERLGFRTGDGRMMRIAPDISDSLHRTARQVRSYLFCHRSGDV